MRSALLWAVLLMGAACRQKGRVGQGEMQDTSRAEKTTPRATAAKNSFGIDSVKLVDSTKISQTVTVKYNQTALVFSGLNKTVLDSIYNNSITDMPHPADYTKAGVYGALQKFYKRIVAEMKENVRGYNPQDPQVWEKNETMRLLPAVNNYVAVQYEGDGYTGGAHGYSFVQYRTIDLEKQKTIGLNDVLDTAKVNWNRIIRQYAGQRKDDFFDEPLKQPGNFLLTRSGISFIYGEYEAGPYSSGNIEVEVPYTALKDFLHSDFKTRMALK